jgi:hypothetical protein
MPEKPESTQAEIVYSALEYTAIFKDPIFESAAMPAGLVAPILKALAPWDFKLEGVHLKTHSEKLSDYAITFRHGLEVAPDRVLVLALDKATFTAMNLSWEEAEPFAALVQAGMGAIREAARAEVNSQSVTLAMHVQLKVKPRKDVTATLLTTKGLGLLSDQVKSPGVILIGDKATLVIDASVGYENALFIRIVRQHPAHATVEDLAAALRKDEEHLFNVLGLEGIL